MRGKSIAAGVILVVAAGAGLGCYWYFGRPAPVLHLPGTVEIQEVRLSSKVGGRVAKVAVAEGELVEPGQPLVYFEAPELEAQREQFAARLKAAEAVLEKAQNGPRPEEKAAAKAAMQAAEARLQRLQAGWRIEEIEQARHEVLSLEAELERAERELERERRLASTPASSRSQYEAALALYGRLQGQVSAARARLKMLEAGSRPEDIAEARAEVERLRAQYELLQAGTRSEEIAEAEARVAELRARLREIEVNLRETVVYAPERAVVEVVAVRKGDTAAPNQPVVRVLRAEDLWIKAYVPETELGKVRLNQAVEVTCDSYPGRRFQGTVVQIASISEFTPRNVQSADERRHQVFGIKVRVADPQGVFKSGMAADVWLPLQE
ncbi:MAG TPA: efflux RND transporter periplasmic adaptor subunit [Gemmataceae bacterium]|nr:efflux RND transporter periplasmic adaptor subunit [Gemmataceae bacterium]